MLYYTTPYLYKNREPSECQTSYAKTPACHPCLLMEADDDVLLVQEDKGSLDSGCSHHICARREWFSSYEECEGKMVALPNGERVKVAGYDTSQWPCSEVSSSKVRT